MLHLLNNCGCEEAEKKQVCMIAGRNDVTVDASGRILFYFHHHWKWMHFDHIDRNYIKSFPTFPLFNVRLQFFYSCLDEMKELCSMFFQLVPKKAFRNWTVIRDQWKVSPGRLMTRPILSLLKIQLRGRNITLHPGAVEGILRQSLFIFFFSLTKFLKNIGGSSPVFRSIGFCRATYTLMLIGL